MGEVVVKIHQILAAASSEYVRCSSFLTHLLQMQVLAGQKGVMKMLENQRCLELVLEGLQWKR
jgi:hypothetical protein